MHLREGLYFCIANERVVFLDLFKDRYFCLQSELDRQFQTLLSGQVDGTDRSLCEQALTDQGLLTLSQPCAPMPTAAVAAPQFSALTSLSAKVLLPSMIEATVFQVMSQRDFKRRPLWEIIADFTTPAQTPAKVRTPQALANCVTAFHRATRIVTTQDQCLRSSIAFVRFAKRQGLSAHLVIGVRMFPFGAHAWAQDGDCVLNDSLDAVRPYTPILVV